MLCVMYYRQLSWWLDSLTVKAISMKQFPTMLYKWIILAYKVHMKILHIVYLNGSQIESHLIAHWILLFLYFEFLNWGIWFLRKTVIESPTKIFFRYKNLALQTDFAQSKNFSVCYFLFRRISNFWKAVSGTLQVQCPRRMYLIHYAISTSYYGLYTV